MQNFNHKTKIHLKTKINNFDSKMRYFEGFKTPLNNLTKQPAFFAIIFTLRRNFWNESNEPTLQQQQLI